MPYVFAPGKGKYVWAPNPQNGYSYVPGEGYVWTPSVGDKAGRQMGEISPQLKAMPQPSNQQVSRKGGCFSAWIFSLFASTLVGMVLTAVGLVNLHGNLAKTVFSHFPGGRMQNIILLASQEPMLSWGLLMLIASVILFFISILIAILFRP
jgi:hypothetical protein